MNKVNKIVELLGSIAASLSEIAYWVQLTDVEKMLVRQERAKEKAKQRKENIDLLRQIFSKKAKTE